MLPLPSGFGHEGPCHTRHRGTIPCGRPRLPSMTATASSAPPAEPPPVPGLSLPQLLENMPIGVFETTRSGAVRFANRYLLELLRMPLDVDLAKLNMLDGRIIPPEERERFWAKLQLDQEVVGFATILHRRDGARVEVSINARLKTDSDGQPACEGTIEDWTDRREAQREVERLHQQLVLASRQAGMAEVASGVLHTLGNVLTSVNLLIHDVHDRLKGTRLLHLNRAVQMIQRERLRLGEFLTEDPQGRQLPEFLTQLDQHLTNENRDLIQDVGTLILHFEHIREIVLTQQRSTRMLGLSEALAPTQLFEDALRLTTDSLAAHAVHLRRDFAPTPHVQADRHRVLQILVNLLRNADDALRARPREQREVIVRVVPANDDQVAFIVSDNGTGLSPEMLTQIFKQGFTTKKSGHSFGLHASVLAAREMAGDLTAASPGLGRGATFTLTLPIARNPAP